MCAKYEVFYFKKCSINIQKVCYRVDIKSNPDVSVLLETCPEGWGFQLNDANGNISFWLTPCQHDPCFSRILTQNCIFEEI
jgi:hypothetical protein